MNGCYCPKAEIVRNPVIVEKTHGRLLYLDAHTDQQELNKLVHTISHCVARFLERLGILERDEEISYLVCACLEG